MRRWARKTDEAGKPRRFLNHGEVAVWALLTVGKVLGILPPLYWLLSSIFAPSGGGGVGWSMLTSVLVAWLGIPLVLYLYVALSGGVMDDEARRRYRNNETLSRYR